jgi:hypothetical protein
VPGAPEGAVDVTKQRLCILLTFETEYSKQRGIEFMRLKNAALLQGISQREDGKPLFKVAEMMNSREEIRDLLWNVYKAGMESGGGGAEDAKALPFEKERLKRLKEQRIRYLIVPVWCVVNSEEDYKALPDADSIDRIIDEIAKGDHDALPSPMLLSKEETGPAIVQVKNNMDAAVLAYLSSGKRRRAIRVPAAGIWHAAVDGGAYQMAIRSEKEGAKPLYGKIDLAAGTALSMEIAAGAGSP